jgi:hypothetical protein
MPQIIKKCFLHHYDSSVNSDKVFNLFLIDNKDGSYSAISEYGRSETKLNVKPLVEDCSLPVAESRYSAKRFEKVHHKKTPYIETFNCSYSPTVKKYGSIKEPETTTFQSAKVLDFKPADTSQKSSSALEKESGEQTVRETTRRRSKQIGVLNLNQLDALEF